jgi:hypothetical protein
MSGAAIGEWFLLFVLNLFHLCTISTTAIRQSLGAFAGRNTTAQRRSSNDAAAANGSPQLFPGTTTLANARNVGGNARSSTTRPNASDTDPAALRAQQRAVLTNSLENISVAAVQANLIESWNARNLFRNQQISHLHLALQIASCPSYSPTNTTMTRLISLCNAEFEEPPVLQPIIENSVPVTSNPSVHPAPNDSSRNVRQRVENVSNAPVEVEADCQHFDDFMSRFTEMELGGDGQCLFFVLRYLQDHEVGHEIRAEVGILENNEDVITTRNRIVNHLDEVKDTLHGWGNCLVSAGMAEECGDASSYIEWMRLETSCGGVIEVNAWAHLMKQHVFIYSTTVIRGGGVYTEEFNYTPSSHEDKALHILHRVARGALSSLKLQLLNKTLIHSHRWKRWTLSLVADQHCSFFKC